MFFCLYTNSSVYLSGTVHVGIVASNLFTVHFNALHMSVLQYLYNMSVGFVYIGLSPYVGPVIDG